MANGLPPLATLRAFEAAAQLGSFTRAAQMLNLSQGAVSYRIKLLEDQLNVKLFVRQARGLVLSPKGELLARSLVSAFEALEAAIDQVALSRPNKNAVSVAVPGVFATKWLAGRIADFHACHPHIELRLVIADDPSDLSGSGCDGAIHWNTHRQSGGRATPLGRDIVIPVCSPCLIEGPLSSAQELQEFPLLQVEGSGAGREGLDWRIALSRGDQSLSGGRATRSAYWVSTTKDDLALQLAVEGHGVALTRGLLVADDLAAGRLIRPLPLSFGSVEYCFVEPSSSSGRSRIDAFKTWLATSIRATLLQLRCDVDQAGTEKKPLAGETRRHGSFELVSRGGFARAASLLSDGPLERVLHAEGD
jgi:LysR family transcriptional regulator, glycine cleavage system transcriptional activator